MLTFKRPSKVEYVFSDIDDFGTNAIAREKSDGVAFGWLGGGSGAPDSAWSQGGRFKKEHGFDWMQRINLHRGSRSNHWTVKEEATTLL